MGVSDKLGVFLFHELYALVSLSLSLLEKTKNKSYSHVSFVFHNPTNPSLKNRTSAAVVGLENLLLDKTRQRGSSLSLPPLRFLPFLHEVREAALPLSSNSAHKAVIYVVCIYVCICNIIPPFSLG